MTSEAQTTQTRSVSILAGAAVIAALYLGKEFFLPLVLAILISFLLAPLIRRFEKWKMGRVTSVIVATLLAFSVLGGIGYVVAGQLLDLANKLPNYKSNLLAKVQSLKSGEDSAITKATRTLREVATAATAPVTHDPLGPPLTDAPEDVRLALEPSQPTPAVADPASSVNPTAPAVPVEVVGVTDPESNPLTMLRDFVGPILAPLGTAAVVIVFVIFMLLEREDLRDRFIHLIGRQRLHLTTQALDDAGKRISRYLLAQLIVNATYGIPIGIGLYFIGIPNAVLWGLLATVLRFIPYLGPWIASAFPIALSLAIAPSWTAPLLTLGLFLVVELISNNVVEPWLYGASTGLSAMAIIVSAVFWTWLWGTVGLLLATPLTVCVAVLGKYIPSLGFLEVLLGDAPPIAPGDRFYQRLLALDEEEAVELVEEHIKRESLASAYDNVMMPAVRLMEHDCRSGAVDDVAHREIYGLVRRILAEIDETPPPADTASVPVICLPASSEADELIAIMLAHLLEKRSIMARVVSSKSLASEMVETAGLSGAPVIFISAMPPASVMPATYLCKRLRVRLPGSRLVVGLWSEFDLDRRRQRLEKVQADEIFVSLEKAAADIAIHVAIASEAPAAAPETAVASAALVAPPAAA